ncbi:MAG: hypothetical protein ACE5NP_04640 [Anaerolineae bacterium]
MDLVIALLGSAGLASLLYVTQILAKLSQKLGEVTKMKEYFRAYRLSLSLFGTALFTQLLKTSTLSASHSLPFPLDSDLFYMIFYHIPLAAGATIALAITIKYWGWLLRQE